MTNSHVRMKNSKVMRPIAKTIIVVKREIKKMKETKTKRIILYIQNKLYFFLLLFFFHVFNFYIYIYIYTISQIK